MIKKIENNSKKNNLRTEKIGIAITPDLKNLLDKRMQVERRSRCMIVVMALEKYLSNGEVSE
jgi:hypothetical protein